MIRPRIVRTLLKKEILRFRYNWGLLVMVGSVIGLAGLVSISARMNQLPGQETTSINRFFVLVDAGDPQKRAWADYLQAHPPGEEERRIHALVAVEWVNAEEFHEIIRRRRLPTMSATVELRRIADDAFELSYRYQGNVRAGLPPYQQWVERSTREFLASTPRLTIDAQSTQGARGELLPSDKISLIFTALVIFAFYLLSFNLYLTSTGEEREKKVLLALMLSPARPVEIIGAKILFYATAGTLVAAAVLAMYRPVLLLHPMFWFASICGATCYVCIATVFLCLVRRQSTINTISMIYLVASGIIMMLSQFLVPLVVLRGMLVENYLHRQMDALIADKPYLGHRFDVMGLLMLTAAWVVVAVLVFRVRSTRLSSSGR